MFEREMLGIWLRVRLKRRSVKGEDLFVKATIIP